MSPLKHLYNLLLFFTCIPAFGMEDHIPEFMHMVLGDSHTPMYQSPEQLIENHIKFPLFINTELKKYSVKQLQNFRSLYTYNNLLHCLVKKLAETKDYFEDFDQAIDAYKPILTWLVSIGLSINEVNNDHDTPLIFAYRAEVIINFKEQGNKIQPLILFLEHDLGAHPTYASIAPEFRFCKTFLWKLITCDCCKRKYS